jgi:hypothetical protein
MRNDCLEDKVVLLLEERIAQKSEIVIYSLTAQYLCVLFQAGFSSHKPTILYILQKLSLSPEQLNPEPV